MTRSPIRDRSGVLHTELKGELYMYTTLIALPPAPPGSAVQCALLFVDEPDCVPVDRGGGVSAGWDREISK